MDYSNEQIRPSLEKIAKRRDKNTCNEERQTMIRRAARKLLKYIDWVDG